MFLECKFHFKENSIEHHFQTTKSQRMDIQTLIENKRLHQPLEDHFINTTFQFHPIDSPLDLQIPETFPIKEINHKMLLLGSTPNQCLPSMPPPNFHL